MQRFAILALAIILAACSVPEKPVRLAGSTMGTTYHVACNCADTDTNALQQEIDTRLAEINRIMSTYDPQSELSRINSGETTLPATISPELMQVLRDSAEIYANSDGFFDVTVGPLVNLWGFGPTGTYDVVPADGVIAETLAQTGFDAVVIEGQEVDLAAPRYIDLSAIAKGWAVDDIASLLEARGVSGYMVEIGGELRTNGKKPDGSEWRIAIERPSYTLDGQTAEAVLEPGNAAIATSGDYRNYFEVDGVRYSHTINPASGRPINHNLASVTVVAERCGLADGWATAINVAGPVKGMELAEKNGLAVFMIVREGDRFAEKASSAFLKKFPEFGPGATGE